MEPGAAGRPQRAPEHASTRRAAADGGVRDTSARPRPSPPFRGLAHGSVLATATHEAGHAIVGLAHHLRIARVTLVRSKGHVLLGGLAGFRPFESYEDDRACLLGPQRPVPLDSLRGHVFPYAFFVAAGPATYALLGINPRCAGGDREVLEGVIEQVARRPSYKVGRGYDQDIRRTLAYSHAVATDVLIRNGAWSRPSRSN